MTHQKEISAFPGFYEINGFSLYGLSKTGEVFNLKKQCIVIGCKNPKGYHNFRLLTDLGTTLTIGRHRLLGIVFLDKSKNDESIINHKNGIKGDDRLENLEWVSYRGNLSHAGKLGLTDKIKPITIRHVRKKETLTFDSYTECAKFLGVTKDTVSYRAKSNGQRVFSDGYQYKDFSSISEWRDIFDCLLQMDRTREIIVRDVFTGEEYFFQKSRDLAIKLNVSESTLCVWLKRIDMPVLPGFIQLKCARSLLAWRIPEDPIVDNQKFTGKKFIVVFDENLGMLKIFSSIVECASVFNIKITTLHYRINSKDNNLFDGRLFSYYDDLDSNQRSLAVEMLREMLLNCGNPLRATDTYLAQ